MPRLTLTLLLLNLATHMAKAQNHSAGDLITTNEKKIELKLLEYCNIVVKWLEEINDKHLLDSTLGKLISYKEMKPKLNQMNEARGSRKMSLALLPIIFHVGAATAWLAVTTMLSAKSVAIGMILLIFKIAVSTAKISSFFTAWKLTKHHEEVSWVPHHDLHKVEMLLKLNNFAINVDNTNEIIKLESLYVMTFFCPSNPAMVKYWDFIEALLLASHDFHYPHDTHKHKHLSDYKTIPAGAELEYGESKKVTQGLGPIY